MWIGLGILLMALYCILYRLEPEKEKSKRYAKRIVWGVIVALNVALWMRAKEKYELHQWVSVWLTQSILLTGVLSDFWRKEVNPLPIYSLLPAAIVFRILFWQEFGGKENLFCVVLFIIGAFINRFSKQFLQRIDYMVLLALLLFFPIRIWITVFMGSLLIVVILGCVLWMLGKKTKEFPYLPMIYISFSLWMALELIYL